MTTHAGKSRLARLVAAAVLGIVVSAVVLAWVQPVRGADVAAGEFCATAPAEAHADQRDAAAVMLSAVVPAAVTLAMPDVVIVPVAASQGDVVRVTVRTPRDGAVAVHGLLDVRPVAAHGEVTVEFRAIYSGRFPVHFHGADGSHIQIATIEVAPHSSFDPGRKAS